MFGFPSFAKLFTILIVSMRVTKSFSFKRSITKHSVIIRHDLLARSVASKDAIEFDLSADDDELDEDIASPQSKLKRNDHEWMFFDVAKINVQGGEGGDGCMAMRREWHVEFGGPSGGNGGNGGSVYLECDPSINTLAMLRRRVHHKGRDGKNGQGKSRHGQKGDDCIIQVPAGTIVRDHEGVLAGELNQPGQRLLVARGGKGGRGNEYFKTARMNAPTFAEKGEPGAERWINVELKLLADVGLVGVPNAGKSTLLAASSNAKPKIADYPFTTVVPNLGVCDLFSETEIAADGTGRGLVIADIPGLLEGAHEGVGLGLAFLRHVERCRVLIHVVSGSSPDPIGDFRAINEELRLFNPKLALKPQVVVINKIDIPEVREMLPIILSGIRSEAGHNRIMEVSAATGEKVRELMGRVKKLVEALPVEVNTEDDEERVDFSQEDSEDFEILSDPERYPGQFRVVGDKIEKLVITTNWDYYEATQRFQRILEARGINAALKQAGAKEGDLIMIGEWDFDYCEKRSLWTSELGLNNLNPRKRPSYSDD